MSSTTGSNSGTSTAGFTLMELLMVVAIIGLLVAVLLPVAGMVRASARTLACFNNLHQIGIASLSWSQDNRGNVVTAWDDTYGNNIRSRWQGMLRPYMFDNEVNVGDRLDATFRCPEVRRDMTWSNDDASTYGKNIWTGQCPAPQNDNGYPQIKYAKIHAPSEMLFLADTAAYDTGLHPHDLHPWISTGIWGVALSHRGKGTNLMMDGHTQSLVQATAQAWNDNGCQAFWTSRFWSVLAD